MSFLDHKATKSGFPIYNGVRTQGMLDHGEPSEMGFALTSWSHQPYLLRLGAISPSA